MMVEAKVMVDTSIVMVMVDMVMFVMTIAMVVTRAIGGIAVYFNGSVMVIILMVVMAMVVTAGGDSSDGQFDGCYRDDDGGA